MSAAEQTVALSDRDRETRIEAELICMVHAVTPDDRREHFERMKALIAGRSAEQIALMEREREIARKESGANADALRVRAMF